MPQKKKKTIIFSFVSLVGGILLSLILVWAVINNQKNDKPNNVINSEQEIKEKIINRKKNLKIVQTAISLELEEKDLPDLTAKQRIGVINSSFGKENEYLIVILKKTDQELKSSEEVEKKLVVNNSAELVKLGVKKLFEIKPDLVWEWEVYCFSNSERMDASNGVPLLLALYSAYYQKSILNDTVATGAVDKEGNIWAVGSFYEKIIAAVETGNKSLIFPADRNWDSEENEIIVDFPEKYATAEQVAEFSERYMKKLEYVPVKNWRDLTYL